MAKAIKPSTIAPQDYADLISCVYAEKGDPERAEAQSAYMKLRFPYYGLKAPEWVAILKEIFRKHGLYEGAQLQQFVRCCNEMEYREMHYAGLQMLEKRTKYLPEEAIGFLEECALTNAWWDTVDWINKLIGIHLKRFPDMQGPLAERWIKSDSIWLQRLAHIHQLTFYEKTDWELMQQMILYRADSREFFVQKAAGWALRQYSKTNGAAVRMFISEHEAELSGLTIREGLKWMKAREL